MQNKLKFYINSLFLNLPAFPCSHAEKIIPLLSTIIHLSSFCPFFDFQSLGVNIFLRLALSATLCVQQ